MSIFSWLRRKKKAESAIPDDWTMHDFGPRGVANSSQPQGFGAPVHSVMTRDTFALAKKVPVSEVQTPTVKTSSQPQQSVEKDDDGNFALSAVLGATEGFGIGLLGGSIAGAALGSLLHEDHESGSQSQNDDFEGFKGGTGGGAGAGGDFPQDAQTPDNTPDDQPQDNQQDNDQSEDNNDDSSSSSDDSSSSGSDD